MDRSSVSDAKLLVPARSLLRLVAGLSALVLVLGYLHSAQILFGVPPEAMRLNWFSLNAELSLPAWYSSLVLFTIGVFMLLSAALERQLPRSTSIGWLLLGLGFVYLSLDEMVSIHEQFGRLTGDLPDLFGFLSFRWLIIGIPIVAFVAAGFAPFLIRLPRPTRIRLIIAGAIYVAGSIGVEMIGARLHATLGAGHIAYILTFNVEETLEIIGMTLALRAVILHLVALPGGATIHLAQDSA